MKMWVCDRCGVEMTNASGRSLIQAFNNPIQSALNSISTSLKKMMGQEPTHIDLCEKCSKEFDRWLNNGA